MKYLLIVCTTIFSIFLVACSSGSSSTSASNTAIPNEAVTDQTVRELLLNGEDLPDADIVEGIETIWVCSSDTATRGYGLVFLDDPNGQDVGFFYTIDALNIPFFWSVNEDNAVELRGYRGIVETPEFSGTSVFTSASVTLVGAKLGPTTCIKEKYVRPVVIGL